MTKRHLFDADAAIALIIGGASLTQAGEAQGVTDRSIHRWMSSDANLRTRLAEAMATRDASRLLGHGTLACYRRGCKCRPCLAANRDFHMEQRQRRENLEPHEHGLSAFTNWNCRCEICRAAVKENNKRLRQRVRSGKIQHRPESTGYLSGCPCQRCRIRYRPVARRRWHQRNAATLDQARRHYYVWTGPELEILERDITGMEAAQLLGRTYSAVKNMRAKLKVDPRKINLAGVPVARKAAP